MLSFLTKNSFQNSPIAEDPSVLSQSSSQVMTDKSQSQSQNENGEEPFLLFFDDLAIMNIVSLTQEHKEKCQNAQFDYPKLTCLAGFSAKCKIVCKTCKHEEQTLK